MDEAPQVISVSSADAPDGVYDLIMESIGEPIPIPVPVSIDIPQEMVQVQWGDVDDYIMKCMFVWFTALPPPSLHFLCCCWSSTFIVDFSWTGRSQSSSCRACVQ